MAILTESLVLDFSILLVGIFFFLYFFMTRNFNYWKKKGVVFLKPTPFLGNFKRIVFGEKSIGEHLTNLYQQFNGEPFVGIFAFDRPMLLVRDIELVKSVLVKDFNYFADRSFKPDVDLDPLGAKNLFGMAGPKWRHLRSKLTPTFSSGKMKMMFHLVNKCGKDLAQYLEEHAKSGEVEIKETLARYTTDVIATCAFGIECNSLKDPEAEFRKVLRKIFEFSQWKNIKMAATFFAPAIVSRLRLRTFEVEVTDFLRKVVWDTVEYREKNGVVRKDFLDLLIQIKNKGRVDDDEDGRSNGVIISGNDDPKNTATQFSLEGDDFVAQAFIFLAAGFETSSTTMTFALFELCHQTDLQNKLRQEIQSVLANHKDEVTYDAIKDMQYLDMVVSETLRKYPVLAFLDRQALQNYKIPGSEFIMEKGSALLIPVMGIHRDPLYYPNPNHFDPERFTEENKKKRPNYTYMPFGEGPRICIGMRMGLMQVKVGLIHILSQFEVLPTKKTPATVIFDPNLFLLNSRGELPLTFRKMC